MLSQGENPKVIQERLGHAKAGTRLAIYSHVLPSIQQSATLHFDKTMARARTSELAPKPVSGCIGTKGKRNGPRIDFEGHLVSENWSGRWDSNPRPSPWQGDALPLSHFRLLKLMWNSVMPAGSRRAEGQSRTGDTGIFSAVLYHLSYLGIDEYGKRPSYPVSR